jgi:excisionase family DNA binding protein
VREQVADPLSQTCNALEGAMSQQRPASHLPRVGGLHRRGVDAPEDVEDVMDKLLLTPVEAAQALGIGRSKVYELLQSGQLKSVRIGSCRRVPLDAVHDLLTELRRTG